FMFTKPYSPLLHLLIFSVLSLQSTRQPLLRFLHQAKSIRVGSKNSTLRIWLNSTLLHVPSIRRRKMKFVKILRKKMKLMSNSRFFFKILDNSVILSFSCHVSLCSPLMFLDLCLQLSSRFVLNGYSEMCL
ncbi:hypothetical protein FRX31_003877, partial [Thalictrum thalictroides]